MKNKISKLVIENIGLDGKKARNYKKGDDINEPIKEILNDTKYIQRLKTNYYQYARRINYKLYRINLQTKEIAEALKYKKILDKLTAEELEKFKISDLRTYKNLNTNSIVENIKKSITFKEIYTVFIENVKRTDKVSIHSINKYITTYNLINSYYKNKDINTIKLVDYNKFIDYLKSKKLNPKTINNHLTYLKMYINYAIKIELIEKNDASKIELLQEQQSEKENFNNAELKELLQIKNKDYGNLIKFALYTGMRINEIIKLTKENVKVENNITYLEFLNSKEKGGKKIYRIVPLHSEIIQLADLEFLSNIKNSTAAKDKIKQITKNANNFIQNEIHNRNKTFHCLRANFISELVSRNVELYLIKKLAGHTDKNNAITIDVYAKKIDINILSNAINKLGYFDDYIFF